MLIPDRSEIYRYLGYHGTEPEENVTGSVEACLQELLPMLVPKEIHRFFPLEKSPNGGWIIEGITIKSTALERNLDGCTKVCLMAATIGFGPDRLSERARAEGKMSRSVIFQAAGSASIERWCDEVNDKIRSEAKREGFYTRPRFSPGYGDFSLDFQEQLFRILGVSKTIGVTLTEHQLMMPSKSVTALIGLGRKNLNCEPGGCEICARRNDCVYRRDNSVTGSVNPKRSYCGSIQSGRL